MALTGLNVVLFLMGKLQIPHGGARKCVQKPYCTPPPWGLRKLIIIIIIIIKTYIAQLGHDRMRFTISLKERLKMNKIYKN